MRRRTWVMLAGGLAAAVAVGLGIAHWSDGEGAAPPILREYAAGKRPAAPPISGELLDGAPFDVASLRGEVVVVNVWASWCAPCRAETADLERVNQATAQLGVSFVGINIRDNRDKAINFLHGRVSYPSIFDPAFETGLGFADPPPPLGPPATLVVDRHGDLAAAIYRVVSRAELEQLVRRVAAEPADREAPGDG